MSIATSATQDLNALEQVLSARRVLFVGAHPDDPDAFAAGTVARLTDAGAQVRYVVATSGDKGVPNGEPDPFRFIALREDEQRRSAAYLGVEEVIFLRHRDGEVYDTQELRGQIVREIRRLKADLVITHDPLTRNLRQHPDHRAVGFATLAAVFPACRLETYFPEHAADGLEPHIVHMLLLGGGEPNLWIDISDTFQRKIEALRLHETQFGQRDWDDMLERWRKRAADSGAPAGLTYAESFAFAYLD
ncbi:MAG: PIG-L family deacetylase [Chloroflexi bacterium]|nr:MAG: PIG-L family deacetylase [Chloroflexota bacterium]